jgi:hypothetical protein
MPDPISEAPSEQFGSGCGCKSSSKGPASAHEILDRRYASGEINREQYETMQKDIGIADAKASTKGCC